MHKDVVPNKCVTCHMVTSPYVDSLHIAQTGHTFMPNGKACAGCHADFDTLLASFDYRRVQTVTDSLATELSNRLAAASPADSATDAFKRAKFNYDFVEEDMSHGIHNTKYAQGLLLSALENFSPESVIEPVNSGIPTTYTLGQNYPNPFNPTTSISFALPARQFVRLQVFNVLGDIVTTLVNQEMPAGTYRVTWSGRSLNGAVVPSGVYLYKLDAGTFSATRKMTMMK
jgi:hypothetical protein